MGKYTKSFQLVEATIDDVQKAVEEGHITYRELVLEYLKRIAEYDRLGPQLHSVIEINPDALFMAEGMDAERRISGIRGPLHGIPILIKDNINTHDKMHTTAGSLALQDNYAPDDAFLIKQLRKAGAVILGKTNLTEFANFLTDGMPAGYSSRGGQTKNPYGAHLDVGGSSAGSGAAVAANFCMAAIGTETSGSILDPSGKNAIVGIKPTVGLISRTGIIPISHRQDTAGPMARTVRDCALLLGPMVGIDNSDPATLTSRGKAVTDYTQYLNKDGLKGARIGVPKDYFFDQLTIEEVKIMEETVAILGDLGAEMIDPTDILTERQLTSQNAIVYEFKVNINHYLAIHAAHTSIKSLEDLIRFNEADPEKMLKYGQTHFIHAQDTSGALIEPDYLHEKINDIRMSQQAGIDTVMREYQLDGLLFPEAHGSDIAGRAGYPSIIIPAGYTSTGKPFGITFTSGAYTENKLISFGYAFEQATCKRKAPKFL